MAHVFLDIVPIARRTTFERMGDGVMAMDINNNIVDFNPAVQKYFELDPKLLGNPIESVMEDWPELVDPATPRFEKTSQATVIHEDRAIVFDIRVTLLEDKRGQTHGKLIVFRDIIEQHRAEHALGSSCSKIGKKSVWISWQGGIPPKSGLMRSNRPDPARETNDCQQRRSGG